MNGNTPDLYAVLHLDPAATGRGISHAYRSLLRAHHPDTRPGDPASSGSASEELHQIMAAYAVLGDPQKRAAYDRQRLRQARPPQPPAQAPAQPPAQAPARAPAGPLGRPAPAGPDLIVGPVRWESRPTPEPPGPERFWILRRLLP